MKRMLIAAAVLLLVVALCTVSIRMQTDSVGYLQTSLEEIQESYDRGDLAACQELTDRFVADFEEKTRFFPFFLRHSDLSRVEEIAVPLPVLLREGDTQHFAAELVRCKNQLQRLYEVELPSLENIL
jgi:hypothetical protein